jgi:DNA-binding NtrC family response regulator
MREGVLFVSPSGEDAKTLSSMLDCVSIAMRRAGSLKEALRKLEAEPFGVVLTEAQLPDGNWTDVLQHLKQSGKRTSVVVTHRFADGQFWADILDLGAYDLLPQPFCSGEVQRILANALEPSVPIRRAAPAA